jgi:hypothetical protein
MNEIDLVKIQAREIFKLRNLVDMQNKLIEDFLRSEAELIRELQETNAEKCSSTTTS